MFHTTPIHISQIQTGDKAQVEGENPHLPPLNDTPARALDKRDYLIIIFSYFSSKPYVVTPHLNRLNETVQMKGHTICLYAELIKIIPNYHQILSLI